MKLFVTSLMTVMFSLSVATAAEFTKKSTLYNGQTSAGTDAYKHDDGVGEDSIGLTAGGTITCLNQFNVIGGSEVLNVVRVAGGLMPAGSPMTIVIFDDPNNDGDPSDVTAADLLHMSAEVTGPSDTDVFTSYPVPGIIAGGAGDSFFVGVCLAQIAGEFPCRIDQTVSQGRSWVAGDASTSFDCTNPAGGSIAFGVIDSFGLPGNWMIRADSFGPVSVEDRSWGEVKSIYR